MPCGLFPKRRIPVLVMIHGLQTFLSHKHGWSSTLITWKTQRQISNRGDIEFL